MMVVYRSINNVGVYQIIFLACGSFIAGSVIVTSLAPVPKIGTSKQEQNKPSGSLRISDGRLDLVLFDRGLGGELVLY